MNITIKGKIIKFKGPLMMMIITNMFRCIMLTTAFINKTKETSNEENLNESKNITDSEVGTNRFPENRN